MRIVLKLGGSLLYGDADEIITDRVRAYAETVKSLVKDGNEFVIVVGGGKPAQSGYPSGHG